MRAEDLRVGMVTIVDGRRYRIEKFLEEPNRGLAMLVDEDHPLRWAFTAPNALIAKIYSDAGDIDLRDQLRDFYDDDQIDAWFATPQVSLGGRTPIDCVAADEAEEVWAVVEQLQTGAFV